MAEQLRAQTWTFWSTLGQGRGEEGKEEVKKATFPTLLTMIVALETDNTKKHVKHTDAFKILQRIEEYLAV